MGVVGESVGASVRRNCVSVATFEMLTPIASICT
jgi:hypothetical protein